MAGGGPGLVVKRALCLLALAAVPLAGCSQREKPPQETRKELSRKLREEVKERLPEGQFIVEDAHLIEYDNHKKRWELTGQAIKSDSKKGQARFEQVDVTFFDKGKVTWAVRAAEAVYSTETRTLNLTGGVRAHNVARATTIEAPYLTYQHEERLVRCDKPVTVRSPSGTLSGLGLVADVAAKEIRLRDRVVIELTREESVLTKD